jgi:hypothetical protein
MEKARTGLLSAMILTSVLFVGCATGYQQRGFTGGYEETRLREDVWSVNFNGNGFTSSQRANDFALLRSAEVALSHGYRYFVIVDSSTQITTSTYQTDTRTTTTGSVSVSGNTAYARSESVTTGGETYTINKPGVTILFHAYETEPDTEAMVFNAAFLAESLRDKYRLD